MASFTDTLVGFNPYYQQIPVDDYVRVGMVKQQQYDQGVAKVQGYIDSIAGMEVVKDIHKDYLQKRVNQLSSEVSKIVGEDFSRQQLVNSVGHLTSQIGADPILQNAQLSTQRYKQGMAEMKRAIQEGKSGPANEWYFQNQVSSWLNDGDVTSSLNAQYTPYTDVNKKVLDVIKGLHPNVHIEDIPFIRGDGGKIILDETGQPKIDMAMMHKNIKDLKPEQIEGAIRAALDQNDLRQLQMDGMYNYRGYDKIAMKKVSDEAYTYRLNVINDTIKGLQMDRLGNIGDPAKVKEIDAKIDALSGKAQQYQQDYRKDIQYLDTNLDGYKASTYLQNYLSRFGDGFAYSEHSLTYENNPYFMAAERRRENDIKWQEFLVNKQFQAADLAIKREKLGIDYQELEIKRMEAQAKMAKAGIGGGDSPLTLTGAALMQPIDQAALQEINTDRFIANVDSQKEAVDNQKMALLAQIRPDLVHVVRDPSGTTKRYEYNVEGKDPNKVKAEAEATILKLRDDFDKGNKVDDATRTYFTNVGNTDRDVSNSQFALTDLQRGADKTWSLKPILDKIPALNVTLSNGQNVSMNAEQQYKFNEKLNSVRKRETGSYGTPYYSYDDQAASKIFVTPQEKMLYEIAKKRYSTDAQEQKILNKLHTVNETANIPGRSITKGRDEYMNNAVRDIVGATQPVGFPIESFKTEDNGRVLSVVSPLLTYIAKNKKSNTNPNFDLDEMSEMLDKKNMDQTQFTLEAKQDGGYAIGFHNKSVTTEPREVDITKEQAYQLFGAKRFLDDFQAIRKSLQLSKSSGRVTTDVQGTGLNSAFSLNNGKITDYGVRFHVEDPLKTGGLQARVYIYDKNGDKEWHETTLRFGSLLNEGQITTALTNLSNSQVEGIMKDLKAQQQPNK